VADSIFSALDPYEFKVYFRLFRLSHGFRQTTCFIGLKALSESTGVSIPHLKRVIPKLVLKGLIRIVHVFNGDKKGTEYEVLTDLTDTGIQQIHNKRHNDHQRNIDHHQSARAGDDDETEETETAHFADVKRLYQELTGNAWKAADTAAYREIADVPAAEASEALRRVAARSPGRANSFRYFVREIKAGPETGMAEREVTTLVEVAREVRSLNTGRYGYTEAEFREDVKTAAARRGAAYGPSVLEEALRRLVGGRTGG
jgi:DNA-binding transcriptional regulator GbsR (MarR family)